MAAPSVTSTSATADYLAVHRRKTQLARLRRAGFYIFVAAFVLFCLLPFIWTVITGFKSNDAVFQSPTTYLPHPPVWTNWKKDLTTPRFTRAIYNSVIISSSATILSLLIGSICAYSLARIRFPGKNLVLGIVLAVAMFPGISIISPLYLQFSDWHLINNKLALIFPAVTFTLPICIWTLNAFFRDLPLELEEAARVDGCTRAQTFLRIVMPLAAPGVFTTAILLFIASWNEYLFARTFMNTQNAYTVTVAIAQFEGADMASATPWGEIAAGAVIITLPLVLLVLIFQRRIVAGLTSGAIKG